ncbi:MAG: DNA repair protein RadA [Proteobacteria bacterium]|nr:DNA repair protein RadA [Pseudomonadota bacterium]MBU1610856.1 DNA repair protein RadA [Pseudomonadota bacterium]
MKTKEIYKCSECGGQSPRWQGQCPGCGAWNTLVQQTVTRKGARPVRAGGESGGPRPLEDLPEPQGAGRTSGFTSLDQVLGDGLMPGGAILLGGEPGIGKSTLLLQMAGKQAALGAGAVYLSGEESLAQLRTRAVRLGLLGPGLLAMATTRSEDALQILEGPDCPELLVVDSVQTLCSANADGIPGSVSQVRAVAAELVEAAKRTQTTLILVGHVTKEGQIAGPKLLEHMVDTVLYLEGDRQHFSRILRVLKNRYGPSDELVVFQMKQDGMVIVDDPSTMFLGAHDPDLPGASLVMAIEGQRPFAVEVQVLASKSILNFPRRTSLGFDTNRLHLILAVMEKRLAINLSQYDLYAKLTGGLAMRDPGLDLGLVAAALSSFYDRPLPEGAVFWGEVDLNGQIRPVSGQDTRMKQATRLGYAEIFEPSTCKTLQQLQARLFGRGK